MILEAQVALMPAGKPLPPETPAFEMPVAPVVLWVILVASTVLMHKVGVEDAALTVFARVTVIIPVAFTLAHPPDNGIL